MFLINGVVYNVPCICTVRRLNIYRIIFHNDIHFLFNVVNFLCCITLIEKSPNLCYQYVN